MLYDPCQLLLWSWQELAQLSSPGCLEPCSSQGQTLISQVKASLQSLAWFRLIFDALWVPPGLYHWILWFGEPASLVSVVGELDALDCPGSDFIWASPRLRSCSTLSFGLRVQNELSEMLYFSDWVLQSHSKYSLSLMELNELLFLFKFLIQLDINQNANE